MKMTYKDSNGNKVSLKEHLELRIVELEKQMHLREILTERALALARNVQEMHDEKANNLQVQLKEQAYEFAKTIEALKLSFMSKTDYEVRHEPIKNFMIKSQTLATHGELKKADNKAWVGIMIGIASLFIAFISHFIK